MTPSRVASGAVLGWQAAGSAVLEGSGVADCLFHGPGGVEGEGDKDKGGSAEAEDKAKAGSAEPSASVLGLDSQQRRGERGRAPSCSSSGSSKHRVARSVLWGHSGPVYGVDLSYDGRFLLSGSGDHSVRLWSVAMGANLVAYKGHTYPVWDVQVRGQPFPCQQRRRPSCLGGAAPLACLLSLWCLHGRWGCRLPGLATHPVWLVPPLARAVQHCPAGQYFASASHDRTARIWSLERAQPLRIMAGHLSDVDCVRWHPNCNYIATGSSDKTVRLWDVQTGEAVRIFVGHKGPLTSLALSPSGRFLASGARTPGSSSA